MSRRDTRSRHYIQDRDQHQGSNPQDQDQDQDSENTVLRLSRDFSSLQCITLKHIQSSPERCVQCYTAWAIQLVELTVVNSQCCLFMFNFPCLFDVHFCSTWKCRTGGLDPTRPHCAFGLGLVLWSWLCLRVSSVLGGVWWAGGVWCSILRSPILVFDDDTI